MSAAAAATTAVVAAPIVTGEISGTASYGMMKALGGSKRRVPSRRGVQSRRGVPLGVAVPTRVVFVRSLVFALGVDVERKKRKTEKYRGGEWQTGHTEEYPVLHRKCWLIMKCFEAYRIGFYSSSRDYQRSFVPPA